jgi:hypothetical protein
MSEAKKKMTEEEILKSLDAIIDETLGSDEVSKETTEPVVKSEESKNESKDANGGDDKIKSGTPMSEEQKAEEAKKAKKSKEDKEKEEKDAAEKAAVSEPDLKKAEKEEKESEEDDEEEDKSKMAKKYKKSMKKSIDELSEHLDSEELELIKAWREENSEEETVESSVDIAKSVSQAIGAQLEDIKKSFDQKLSQKDDMIKSLTDKVNKLSTQPAHGRQSIDSLETIEKGGASNTELSKSQVLETMFELQKAGQGINSQHITEFEVTKNISNPQIKNLVMEATKKRFTR